MSTPLSEPRIIDDYVFWEHSICALRPYFRSGCMVDPSADSEAEGGDQIDSGGDDSVQGFQQTQPSYKRQIDLWMQQVFVKTLRLPELDTQTLAALHSDASRLPDALTTLPFVAQNLTIRHTNLKTRLPVLYHLPEAAQPSLDSHAGQTGQTRQAGVLTIAQIQGKLWPMEETEITPVHMQKSRVADYVHRLAFRCRVFQLQNPQTRLRPVLVFPSSGFSSPHLGLLDKAARVATHGEFLDELDGFFVIVDATEAVESVNAVWKQNPRPIVQKGGSTPSGFILTGSGSGDFAPGGHCVSCAFRKSGAALQKGCWELHSPGKRFPDRQVPELPGHGNQILIEQGILFQEDVLSEDTAHPPLADASAGSNISLQTRRAWRIRQTREDTMPVEWIHPRLADKIKDLAYPLHFLDFEAVNCPMPLRRGGRAYDSEVFQFSCHTMTANGRLRHCSWVDRGFSPEPERDFVKALLAIEGIDQGTILHYSPFEHQRLQAISKRLFKEENPLAKQLNVLLQTPVQRTAANPPGASSTLEASSGVSFTGEALPPSANPRQAQRFVDLSNWVKDHYFNQQMGGGLGLKDLLEGILAVSPDLLGRIARPEGDSGVVWDSEGVLKWKDSPVRDGSVAMQLYLLMRLGVIDESRHSEWFTHLERYCALDTLAMLLAIEHWKSELGV